MIMPLVPDGILNTVTGLNWTFPRTAYVWDSSESLRVPLSPIVYKPYVYDHMAGAVSLREVASERLSFELIEPPNVIDAWTGSLDNFLANLGRGQLWIVNDAAQSRWAWIRMAAKPTYTFNGATKNRMSVALDMLRLSDWV